MSSRRRQTHTHAHRHVHTLRDRERERERDAAKPVYLSLMHFQLLLLPFPPPLRVKFVNCASAETMTYTARLPQSLSNGTCGTA